MLGDIIPDSRATSPGIRRLAVFPGDEIETVAQQMNNAGLDHRLWKNGGNRVGKPFEAVDDGDQNVLDATVFQLVHDAQPEFGTLIFRRHQKGGSDRYK